MSLCEGMLSGPQLQQAFKEAVEALTEYRAKYPMERTGTYMNRAIKVKGYKYLEDDKVPQFYVIFAHNPKLGHWVPCTEVKLEPL